ncbi:MAG TPA: hypothetical protein VKE92_14955 [Anaerolineales bacterium]|nr:hypothetical protein [Anaerolineales bacterium]
MADGSEGLRRGSRVSFWGTINASNVAVGESVSANAVSRAVQVGRGTNMFCWFVSSDGASSFQLQAAHVGEFSSQGTVPDPDDITKVWHDLWYMGNSASGNSTNNLITFTGSGTIASIIPDFEPDWVRIKCITGTTVTVIAGFEAWGD